MKFPEGQRLRIGPWGSVTKFTQAEAHGLHEDGYTSGAQLSVGGIGGSTKDWTAEFWASCAYLRDFDPTFSDGTGNTHGWDGSLRGGTTAFVHPEAGEAPVGAMAFFQLSPEFFSAPHNTVEVSVPIATCTCLHEGTTSWYDELALASNLLLPPSHFLLFTSLPS